MRNLFFYGQSGSGKDTLANYFRDKHHYLKFRCAGTIKQVLSEKNGLNADELEIMKRRDERLRKAHWKFGDEYNGKNHASVLQRLKNIVNRDGIEFDIMPSFIHNFPLIISDTRLRVEIEYLLNNGFTGIFLTRKTAEFKKNKHSTEHDLFDNGTIHQLVKSYPRQCLIVCNDLVEFNSAEEEQIYKEDLVKKLSYEFPDALNILVNLNPTGEQLVQSFHQNLMQLIPNLMDDISPKNKTNDDGGEPLYMSR